MQHESEVDSINVKEIELGGLIFKAWCRKVTKPGRNFISLETAFRKGTEGVEASVGPATGRIFISIQSHDSLATAPLQKLS